MKTGDFAGALLVLLAAVLAGGGIYGARSFKRAKFDADTLCPAAGPAGASVVIVDKTDRLTQGQQAVTRDIVARERDALSPGVKIVVAVLSKASGLKSAAARTVVALCNPGSEANLFFENPRRVLARYNQNFKEPLEDAIQSIAEEGSAPNSPIAQAIGSAIVSEGVAALPNGKLTLVSDLMEHSPLGSAYDGSFSKDTLQKAFSQEARTWLKTATVQILLLPRPAYAARQKAAEAVWLQYFKELGGREPSIVRLWEEPDAPPTANAPAAPKRKAPVRQARSQPG